MADYSRALKLSTYTTVTFNYSVTETATTTTYKLTTVKIANSRSTGTTQKLIWYIRADLDSPSQGTQVKMLTEKTYTLAKGTKTKTVTLNVSASITKGSNSTPAWMYLQSDLDTTDYETNWTKDAYYSHPAAALAKYTIAYNANGGSGAPPSQTKTYGKALALSSTRPTRTNYVFKSWNTKADGSGTSYSPGGSYTANAAATLYAQWYPPYTVAYNANGGTGAPASQTKVYNTALTLSPTAPTRTDHEFVGWATTAGATSAQYQPGGSYTANAAATLYAVWRQVYASPSLTVARSYRCDQSGAVADEGSYAAIELAWSIFDTGANAVREISATVNGHTASVPAAELPTGLSGTTKLVVDAQMETERSYAVTASITDAGCAAAGVAGSAATTTRADSISEAYFPMDFIAGGHGAGIGTPATEEGALRIAHRIRQLDEGGDTVLLADREGNLTIAGKLAQSSDARLKEHVSWIGHDGAELARSLRPALYVKDGATRMGLYAQDVLEAGPLGETAVTRLDDGTLALDYTALVAPLIAYMQELEETVRGLAEKAR